MGNVSVLTLDAGPAAARRARHFVQESVGPGRSDLTADVELVVTELVTNAFLHGEPPVRLAIDDDGDSVRVEVTDAGALPPILVFAGSDAMTGRGLALVAALAGRWGVDPLAGSGGKVVWAELGSARVPATAGTGTPPAAPAGEDRREVLYEVTIGSVATELLVAAKAHLDNVVRELVLLRGGEAASGVALPDEVAELVEIVTGSFAAARSQLKQQAMAALTAGQELTELVLHLPTVTARAGERYLDALDELDRYARAARMLSLAAPVEHRLFRRWYVRTIVEQLGALAAGREAPRARPFQLVLADEVAKTAPMVDTAARLSMLHQVNQRLAAALTAQEMADIAVEEAITVLGVKTARVRLVEPDGTLRSIAWRGQPGTTDVSPAGYPVAADLPSSAAARTGQPGFVRSLGERLAGVPGLAERFSATRSARIMPLNAAGRTLGLLILTFTSGELSDEVEVALATSLADTLAQSLARAELASRDAERGEVASFLADASQVLISARQPLDVLQGLADLAVPRLADWCTVYLPGDEPGTLRRAAIAIAGHPDLAEQLKRQPLDLAGDTPHARVFASGRPEAVPTAAGRLLEGLYPGLDFEALGGDLDESSGSCLPISLRGQVIGLVGVTQLTPGRTV
ncbi:GAF domain-containing protein, partial [Acidimicrobiaceae bacterium USS-CC1]|nr:GAF domain-containing protein [Acidiferrimicrobium australe]